VRRGTPKVEGLPFFEVDDTLAALGSARAGRGGGMLPKARLSLPSPVSSGKERAPKR